MAFWNRSSGCSERGNSERRDLQFEANGGQRLRGYCPHPRAPGALALSLDRERDLERREGPPRRAEDCRLVHGWANQYRRSDYPQDAARTHQRCIRADASREIDSQRDRVLNPECRTGNNKCCGAAGFLPAAPLNLSTLAHVSSAKTAARASGLLLGA